jgi:hypothetical protein
VLVLADLPQGRAEALLGRYGLELSIQAPGEPVPGTFWGEPEAGIVGRTVFARADTPVHSLLHETCHTICMTTARRETLLRDAGGDDIEEAAVCYLQIVLADELEGVGADRLMADMDAWGYSFRLGSASAWFREDAADARQWLVAEGLLDSDGRPRFALRA